MYLTTLVRHPIDLMAKYGLLAARPSWNSKSLASLRRVAIGLTPPGCRGLVFGRASARKPNPALFLPFPCGLLLATAEGAGALPAVEGGKGDGGRRAARHYLPHMRLEGALILNRFDTHVMILIEAQKRECAVGGDYLGDPMLGRPFLWMEHYSIALTKKLPPRIGVGAKFPC